MNEPKIEVSPSALARCKRLFAEHFSRAPYRMVYSSKYLISSGTTSMEERIMARNSLDEHAYVDIKYVYAPIIAYDNKGKLNPKVKGLRKIDSFMCYVIVPRARILDTSKGPFEEVIEYLKRKYENQAQILQMIFGECVLLFAHKTMKINSPISDYNLLFKEIDERSKLYFDIYNMYEDTPGTSAEKTIAVAQLVGMDRSDILKLKHRYGLLSKDDELTDKDTLDLF